MSKLNEEGDDEFCEECDDEFCHLPDVTEGDDEMIPGEYDEYGSLGPVPGFCEHGVAIGFGCSGCTAEAARPTEDDDSQRTGENVSGQPATGKAASLSEGDGE